MEDYHSNSVETINSHYNGKNGKNFLKRDKQEKHAELFRKDLISAMKMADSENLQPDDYFRIADSWKGEWERGVQVPVNPNAFLPIFSIVHNYHEKENFDLFFLPKKLLHSLDQMNEFFKPPIHEPYSLLIQQQNQCGYDMDELDAGWLRIYNQMRDLIGEFHLSEDEMERVIEELEVQTRMMMTQKIDDIERLGIEYDESVVCDVCRSPEGEEDNEMVFCDNCDICVHQACYGIQEIPDGSWLCRTCSINIRPKCLLCSQTGGAMKCTREGDKWAHISCALWIPEVSIGCPEKMEPITDLDLILPSRWSLVCVLCQQESGACIQCSVKSCKVSFHVTCAFRHNLNLTTVIDDETEDVQMKAYCPVHSGIDVKLPNGNEIVAAAAVVNAEDVVTQRKTKRHKEVFTEKMKKDKLRQIGEDFHLFPNLDDVSTNIDLPLDVVTAVYAYWQLKRKSQFNKALIVVSCEEDEDEEKEDEVENEWAAGMMMKMRMFVQLRQDLERVRNLCYMVNKREKTSRRLFRYKEDIFNLQANLYASLVDQTPSLDENNPDKKIKSHEGKMMSDELKNSSIMNSHLSDSDYDHYDEDDGDYRDSVIMTYKRDISDDDADEGRQGGYDEDSDKKYKSELSKSERRRRQEEMHSLLGAHKASGSVYDDPMLVLSCSFQDDDHVDCRLNRHLIKPSYNQPLDVFSEEDGEKEVLVKLSGGDGGGALEFGGDIVNGDYKKERICGEGNYHSNSVINDKSNNYSTNNRANHSKKNFDDDYLVDSLGEEDEYFKEEKIYSKSTKSEGRSHDRNKHRKQGIGARRVGKGVRGRPKKRRGRPPKIVSPVRSPSPKDEDDEEDDDDEREESRMEFEDDDSDYYRRLSDGDCEKDLVVEAQKKGVVSSKGRGSKGGNKGRKSAEVVKVEEVVKPVVVVEKKKRGRKRKSDVLSSANLNNDNRNGNNEDEDEDDFPRKVHKADAPKKRKYTRRVGKKKNNNNLHNKNNNKDTDIDDVTKVSPSLSPPPLSSSSSSSSVYKMFTDSNTDDLLALSDKVDKVNKRNRIISFDSEDDDNDALNKADSADDDFDKKSDVGSVGDYNSKKLTNTIKRGVKKEKCVVKSEGDINKISDISDKNTANMNNMNTNLTTEMLFSSDSEGEEVTIVSKLLSRSKKNHSKSRSSNSILMHDLELSDSNDDDDEKVIRNLIKDDDDKIMNLAEKIEDSLTGGKKKNNDDGVGRDDIGDDDGGVGGNDDGVDAEKVMEGGEKEVKRTESPTLIYPPVTKVASLLNNSCLLPEIHQSSSSSDDDEEEYDDGADIFSPKSLNGSVEKPKSDSKKTGVKNQDMLNVKVKEILLHKLPTKEFIVSSHLKSLVRDFFCGFGNPEKSDCRFTFNGFKMAQGKINC